ncbi:MAG: S8 family serine peptidase, partial [Halioglobus sp.]|nr:S8 family serine peptidase [Halioglobus sp.]
MKHGRLVSLLSAIALLPGCALLGPGASEPLHVMLQGDSAAELATLVETVGGEVTHDLHIIGAVGARVTRGQLRTALESGLVSFHIDDLATDDDAVEDGDDKPCRVRGHIEPGIDNRGISWPLYNKQEDPATWESLEIHWPQRLGEIEGVILDGTPIDRALYTAVAGSGIRVDFPPSARPVIDRQALLRVNFSRAATDQTRARQREFTLEATFAQGCSDKSVPGYDNNHEDYYYNTVAGVDALHRQGITGDGITVAVIDSGLWEHPALARNTRGEPRVLARYDATSGTLQEQVADGSGHGTHMSSIIAHSGPTLSDGQPTGTYKGVAPDANLVAVKVLDREGRAHILDIAQAVQWVVDNRQ